MSGMEWKRDYVEQILGQAKILGNFSGGHRSCFPATKRHVCTNTTSVVVATLILYGGQYK